MVPGKSMAKESIRMVQECVDLYHAETNSNGSLSIRIECSARFADLWLTKLSELRTTEAEIHALSTAASPSSKLTP
jgi:hypothetical protein